MVGWGGRRELEPLVTSPPGLPGGWGQIGPPGPPPLQTVGQFLLAHLPLAPGRLWPGHLSHPPVPAGLDSAPGHAGSHSPSGDSHTVPADRPLLAPGLPPPSSLETPTRCWDCGPWGGGRKWLSGEAWTAGGAWQGSDLHWGWEAWGGRAIREETPGQAPCRRCSGETEGWEALGLTSPRPRARRPPFGP